jgi:hypothetical protein
MGAPHMDPWTLAYLAGHREMNITKRYVHPQEQTILKALRLQVLKQAPAVTENAITTAPPKGPRRSVHRRRGGPAYASVCNRRRAPGEKFLATTVK